MACACKVNQEIDKIYKYYSYNKTKDDNKSKMVVDKKAAAITLSIYLLRAPLVPFMLLFILFSKNKRFSMKKFLGFIHKVRNGREQQDI